MTIRWSGAFADAPIPAGQRITGWIEGPTGAGTLKTRYRDGDPAASALWMELYGNSNHQYAQSRRTVWVDQWTQKTAGSADPAKRHDTADFTEMEAIYAITPPMILLPNVRRGDLAAPRLSVKIAARRSGGGDSFVRVYAAPSLTEGVDSWGVYSTAAPTTQYVEWTINNTAWETDPGWSNDPSDEQTITVPGFTWASYAFPEGADLRDVLVMETVFIVAGIGDGAGNGPLISAIQIREEAPGA